jgi:hypothetical protein
MKMLHAADTVIPQALKWQWLLVNRNKLYICAKLPDSVAQLVEQLTLNQRVESSSLSGVTLKIFQFIKTIAAQSL